MSQDWALSMLAAELAADQRCALQQRLRHQLMGLTMLPVEAEGREWYAVTHRQRGQTKEGAAEAEERHNSVECKLAAKAAAEERRALQHRQRNQLVAGESQTPHGCSAPKSELAGFH